MHILTKIVVVLVVLFIVLPALGFTVFEALLPQLGSAITSTVTSYFSSASSNRTFSSSGVSFNYPANWVSFSPDIISKFVNTQTFTNNTNYTLSMVVPGSLMGGQLLQAPSLILNLLTNKTNLSGVINAMTKNMNAVLAGSVDYKNTTAITPGNIVNSSLFTSLTHSSGISNLSQSTMTIKGTEWTIVNISNFTFDNKVKLTGGTFAMSYVNKTFCFVMGASASQNGISSTRDAFSRVLNSISCA